MAHCSGTQPASWKLEKEGKCGQVGDGDWRVDRQSPWVSTRGWMASTPAKRHWDIYSLPLGMAGHGCTTPCASDTVMRYSPRPHRVFVLAAIYRRSKKSGSNVDQIVKIGPQIRDEPAKTWQLALAES